MIKTFFEADEDDYNRLKNRHEMGIETYNISLFYFLVFEKKVIKLLANVDFIHGIKRTGALNYFII